MPDIDYQKIELNLIPKKGDDPVVFYASQYETARPFIAVLMWGDSEYAPGVDCYAEIDIRKNDDNLVVITDDVSIDNNEVSVILPVQALTCIGKNLGQVKIYAANDKLIAALNFIIEVQPDPLAGGVTSDTAIDNLTQQIEEIAQAEGYLKSEDVAPVALSGSYNDLTDKPTIPDMTNYYTKSETYSQTQVNDALALKANISDLATVATTGDYDDLINKPILPDMTNYYTKSQVDTLIDNIFPTFTASGTIATFTTALNKPLVSVTAEVGATTITRCGKNLCSTNLFNDGSSGGVSYSMGDDEKITVSADSPLGPAQRIDIGSMTLPAGTYTLTGIGDINYLDLRLRTDISLGSTEFAVCNKANPSVSFTLTETTLFYAVFIVLPNFVGSTVCEQMIRISSELSSVYEPYSSQTVPVADATTLTTLSGINNVFADSGNVTVQYKYMSM